MRILAIEASARVASAAVADQGVILAEQSVNGAMTHSETLMPMIAQVMRQSETETGDLEMIAVTKGPGSFTGLRIGAATAKGMALGLEIPVMQVSTLEALAYNAVGFDGLVVPIMDARRSQVYTAVYRARNMRLELLTEPAAMSPEQLAESIAGRGEPVMLLGDAVAVYAAFFQDRLGDRLCIAPAHMCQLRAATVTVLAQRQLMEGQKPVPSDQVRIEYLRKSQAEREREARLQKEKANG